MLHIDESEASPGKWPDVAVRLTKAWRREFRETVVGQWSALEACERYVVLQQLGSVLRTGMTLHVESRLR
jgi:hypothetical protein